MAVFIPTETQVVKQNTSERVKQAKTAAWADVKVRSDLFLITLSGPGQAPQEVDIRPVTPACVSSVYSQWHESSLFTFGDIDALFNESDCRSNGE